MPLFFVGGGIGGVGGLTVEAVETLKRCDVVYVDVYTSLWDESLLNFVKGIVSNVIPADRKMLEDDMVKIVEEGRERNVALLIPGDPFIATTHNAVRVLAMRRKVPFKVVHGISVISAAASASGLHNYKFGRMATLPKTEDTTLYTQPLQTLEDNLIRGLHTLFLLDTAGGGLTIDEGLQMLDKAASELGRDFIMPDMLVIVLARLGCPDQMIDAGTYESMAAKKYPPPPHTIIIPGPLHFMEREIIKSYASDPEVVEKSFVPNPLEKRLRKYVTKCRIIVDEISKQGRLYQYVNYVRNYVDDAEKFMESGRFFDALLAAGYAEGLLDCLRLREEVEFKW